MKWLRLRKKETKTNEKMKREEKKDGLGRVILGSTIALSSITGLLGFVAAFSAAISAGIIFLAICSITSGIYLALGIYLWDLDRSKSKRRES